MTLFSFCIEPTSGLDSTVAASLIVTLKELSQKGKTIVTSIHQPSSHIFQSFDQFILLADGKTIYQGKPSNALQYFAKLGYHVPEQYNPADYVMDLLNSDNEVKEKLANAYQRNKEIEEKNLAEPVTSFTAKMPVEIDDDNKWPINFWGQFTVLYLRSNKIAWKE